MDKIQKHNSFNGKVMLQTILGSWGGRVRGGCIWVRIVTSGGLL
jgi:hypothetical protein